MFTLELTRAEYNQIINQRYLQRWVNHVNFVKQRGMVSLIKPAGELATLQHELAHTTITIGR